MLGPHEVLIYAAMADVGIELAEWMSEEADFTFVVVDQERDDFMVVDETLDLGALIRSESYGVEVVLVHELHGLHDLGIDVHVNQLGFLVVMVILEAHLQL